MSKPEITEAQRAALHEAAIAKLRQEHACLMRLSLSKARRVQQKAIESFFNSPSAVVRLVNGKVFVKI